MPLKLQQIGILDLEMLRHVSLFAPIDARLRERGARRTSTRRSDADGARDAGASSPPLQRSEHNRHRPSSKARAGAFPQVSTDFN